LKFRIGKTLMTSFLLFNIFSSTFWTIFSYSIHFFSPQSYYGYKKLIPLMKE